MPFPPFLIAVLVILCAAVIAVPLFKRLGLGALPGYLVAGAVIGPDGLGIISDIDDPRAIAELGIVFLLFTIGLELSMERLRAIPRGVYGLGIAQIVVTTALIAALFSVYGGGIWASPSLSAADWPCPQPPSSSRLFPNTAA